MGHRLLGSEAGGLRVIEKKKTAVLMERLVTTNHAANGSVLVNLRNAGNLRIWPTDLGSAGLCRIG